LTATKKLVEKKEPGKAEYKYATNYPLKKKNMQQIMTSAFRDTG